MRVHNFWTVNGRKLGILCTDEEGAVDAWVDTFFCGATGVMGMDAEWKPTRNYRHQPRIALLQLSDALGNVLLFHVHYYRQRQLPASLVRALASPGILKVGVGVKDDVLKLQAVWKVDVAGCVDLVPAARLKGDPLPAGHGLAAYAAHYAGVENWKVKRATMSNWEARTLKGFQKTYAAMDAYAGAAAFVGMALDAAAVVTVAARYASPA